MYIIILILFNIFIIILLSNVKSSSSKLIEKIRRYSLNETMKMYNNRISQFSEKDIYKFHSIKENFKINLPTSNQSINKEKNNEPKWL